MPAIALVISVLRDCVNTLLAAVSGNLKIPSCFTVQNTLVSGGFHASPFTARDSIFKLGNVVITFKSVDEILPCYHSHEISLVVLFRSIVCFHFFLTK